MNDDLINRRDKGLDIVHKAAGTAKDYFRDIDKLIIEEKGKQDLVSDADRNVETQIRDALQSALRKGKLRGLQAEDLLPLVDLGVERAQFAEAHLQRREGGKRGFQRRVRHASGIQGGLSTVCGQWLARTEC